MARIDFNSVYDVKNEMFFTAVIQSIDSSNDTADIIDEVNNLSYSNVPIFYHCNDEAIEVDGSLEGGSQAFEVGDNVIVNKTPLRILASEELRKCSQLYLYFHLNCFYQSNNPFFGTRYYIIWDPILDNFAQLKRHRLMTLLAQEYNPELGYTIPESIKATGLEKELMEICERSSELFYKFKTKYNRAAEYCLTNAHRRRVLIAANPRELYHFSRLREDEHAQWDIKATAGNMMNLAKKTAPFSFMLSGGKDQFEKMKK